LTQNRLAIALFSSVLTLAAAPVALHAQESDAPHKIDVPFAHVVTPPVPKAQQASDAEMKDFFEAMHFSQQMAQMKAMLPALMSQSVKPIADQALASIPADKQPTPEQRQQLDAAQQKLLDSVLTIFTEEDFRSLISGIYQQNLTRDDILGITSFYRTQAGQDLLAKQPAIAQQYLPGLMQLFAQKSSGPMADYRKELESIAKSAATTTGTSAPASN